MAFSEKERVKGEEILRSFYSVWRLLPGAKGITYDQLLSMLKSRKGPVGPGGEAFLPGLGMAAIESGISPDRYQSAMRRLAEASKGKVPAKNGDFFNALNGVAISTNFVDAASFVLTESAKDVLKGAQSVGDQLILTGKIANFLLPAILIGGMFFWLNRKSGGDLARAVGSLRR